MKKKMEKETSVDTKAAPFRLPKHITTPHLNKFSPSREVSKSSSFTSQAASSLGVVRMGGMWWRVGEVLDKIRGVVKGDNCILCLDGGEHGLPDR